jgi:single-strand DNA-binding protein
MKFELDGTLKECGPTQQITDKFKKREFVVEVSSGNYTEFIKCEATGDVTAKLDSAKIGNQVVAKCAMRGRYFNRKDGTTGHMNSVVAYNVEVIKGNPEYSISAMAENETPFF